MQLGKICDSVIGHDGLAKAAGLFFDHEKRMNRVVDYLHDDPTGNLSLDRLADVAALSRFHFHRVYRGLMDETATQTVRRMRLHRAAVALVQGGDRVEQTAKSVGYPDLAGFSRTFSDLYQATPAAFRKPGELRPFSLNAPVKGRNAPVKGKLMFPLTIRTDPARRLAGIPHRGPYAGLPAAYDQLFGLWLPGSGEELADRPIFERHLNSPMNTAPEDVVTEICAPLA